MEYSTSTTMPHLPFEILLSWKSSNILSFNHILNINPLLPTTTTSPLPMDMHVVHCKWNIKRSLNQYPIGWSPGGILTGGASPSLGSNICVVDVASKANGLCVLPNAEAVPATPGSSCVLGGPGNSRVSGSAPNQRSRQLLYPRRRRQRQMAASFPPTQKSLPLPNH